MQFHDANQRQPRKPHPVRSFRDDTRKLSIEPLEHRLVPAVFTVNSVDDDSLLTVGPCEVTLRSAIESVNSSVDATNTINFQISGSGVKTISLNSSLPSIDNQVSILGFSQSGSPGVFDIVLLAM